MNPLVSIIIPIYNVEAYLEEAVYSVCNQTYENLEIILVNDGSTDNSGELCMLLASKDARIKVINKPNGGLSSARNIGIDNAHGEYILFIDGDDFIENDSIEILLNNFNNVNEKIAIVSAPCFYSYNKGKCFIYNKNWDINSKRIVSHNNFCSATLEQKTCHSACCKLYKKELLNQVRFRIGKKNEDSLFMFDLSFIMKDREFNMLEIPNKLYYYRVNDASITNNKIKPIQIDIIENLSLMIKETTDCDTIKTLKFEYYKNLITFYSQLITNCEALKQIEANSLKLISNHFKSIRFSEILQNCSNKNIIKYILMKFFRHLYIKTIAIKRKLI